MEAIVYIYQLPYWKVVIMYDLHTKCSNFLYYLFHYEFSSPKLVMEGVNYFIYKRHNILFQWNFFYNSNNYKTNYFLLLQCLIKWQPKGQSNQREHVHFVLSAETQWEVTNLSLTVPEIENKNADASWRFFCFQCFYWQFTNNLILGKFLNWNQLLLLILILEPIHSENVWFQNINA